MSKRAAMRQPCAGRANGTAPLTPPCPLCVGAVRTDPLGQFRAPTHPRRRGCARSPAGDQRADLWSSADQKPQATRSAGRAPRGGPSPSLQRTPALSPPLILPLEARDVRTL
jgi:hypothetical protein